MRPIIYSTELIAACGLYCGACRRFLKEKCQGCRSSWNKAGSVPQNTWLPRCSIRKCCFGKGFHSCADCPTENVNQCKTYNNLMSRMFEVFFNSDRSACIRYIQRYGKEKYVGKMTCLEQMTMKR